MIVSQFQITDDFNTPHDVNVMLRDGGTYVWTTDLGWSRVDPGQWITRRRDGSVVATLKSRSAPFPESEREPKPAEYVRSLTATDKIGS